MVKQQREENSSMLGIPKGGIHNTHTKWLFTFVKLHSLESRMIFVPKPDTILVPLPRVIFAARPLRYL